MAPVLWSWALPVALAATILGSAGCGTSAHVDTGTLQSHDAATTLGLGEVCSSSPQCTSDFCLRLATNAQGAPGLCSAVCGKNEDCGDVGTCLSETVTADGGRSPLDGGACYKTCGATADCAAGIPCVWQAALDAGICQTLTTDLCARIAQSSPPCVACLANQCCGEVTACVEDVACAKLETCSGNCASSWQASGIATAQAVGSCASTRCAAVCN
jgi:hypothetical protein